MPMLLNLSSAAQTGFSPNAANVSSWKYLSGIGFDVVECAYWEGDAAPTVGTHFHDDDQVTIVLSGSRLFRVGSDVFYVRAGQYLNVPAGVAHQSLPHVHPATRCLNIYARTKGYGGPHELADFPDASIWQEHIDPSAVLSVISTQAPGIHIAPQHADIVRADLADDGGCSVSDMASMHGLTREGFTRRFSRDFGIAPHSFQVVTRLNEARRLLRSGADIAQTAAETGFTDQSHLGRHFLRAFGTSPGRYQKSFQ